MDFIKAEIRNLELLREESAFSYSREREQPVMAAIKPGEELSRAYRYIRARQWRIAVIYLDHLQTKYPNWGAVHLAKAIAFYGLDDSIQMKKALQSACDSNSPEACQELESLAPGPEG